MAQMFALPVPPVANFDSRSELLEYLKVWGADHGYAPVIRSSSEGHVTIQCDRSGTYRNTWALREEDRQRKRARVTKNCSFRIKGRCRNEVWTSVVTEALHNHEGSDSPDTHPSLRTMDQQQMNQVASRQMPVQPHQR